jgi:hypothetical protein
MYKWRQLSFSTPVTSTSAVVFRQKGPAAREGEAVFTKADVRKRDGKNGEKSWVTYREGVRIPPPFPLFPAQNILFHSSQTGLGLGLGLELGLGLRLRLGLGLGVRVGVRDRVRVRDRDRVRVSFSMSFWTNSTSQRRCTI